MKRRMQHTASAVLLMLLLAGTTALAGGAQNDIDDNRSCNFCGMDRKAYGFSRMLIQYEDGTSVGLCSLRCAVVELDSKQGRKPKAILAADRNSRVLIDAEKAFWVMGGAKRGVMTSRPKWAFSTKAAAETFVEDYGGSIITWSEALIEARDDLAQEVR